MFVVCAIFFGLPLWSHATTIPGAPMTGNDASPCWCTANEAAPVRDTYEIARVSPDGKLELVNLHILKHALTQEDVGSREVAIIGIVGVHRMGKSTILNLLHRYLTCQTNPFRVAYANASAEMESWLHEDPDYSQCSRLFKTSSQPSTVTKGIWLTKRPYLTATNTAIFLMDTQGLFGNKINSNEVDSNLFYVASLFSSTLIFNVQNQLDTQVVNLLAALTVRMGYEIHTNGGIEPDKLPTGQKLLQQLLFLVRDYHLDKQTLEDYYKENRNNSLNHVRASFDKVNIAFLPSIASNPANLTFRPKTLNENFETACASVFAEHFTPVNIVPKTFFGGHPLTGKELWHRFQHFGTIFSQGKFLSVQDIFQKEQALLASAKTDLAFQDYKENMESEIFHRKYPTDIELDIIHTRVQKTVEEQHYSHLLSTTDYVKVEFVRLFSAKTSAYLTEQKLNITRMKANDDLNEKLIQTQKLLEQKEDKTGNGFFQQLLEPFKIGLIAAAGLIALYFLFCVVSCCWRLRPRPTQIAAV